MHDFEAVSVHSGLYISRIDSVVDPGLDSIHELHI
jgi:hypothetical protein